MVSGWTENTQKPFFYLKNGKKNHPKLKNIKKYAKLSDTPFDQRSLIHREAWFPTCFVRKNQPKNYFLFGNFRPLPNKNVQIRDPFFTLLLPKDSKSLKILDIRIQEEGTKRHLNGTSKVNRRTHGQINL